MKEFAQDIDDVTIAPAPPVVTENKNPVIVAGPSEIDIGPEKWQVQAFFRVKRDVNGKVPYYVYLEICYATDKIQFWWRYTKRDGTPFNKMAWGPFRSLPDAKDSILFKMSIEPNQLERMA